MKEKEFDVLNDIRKNGNRGVRPISSSLGISIGLVSSIKKKFAEEGLIDEKGITEEGLKALKPYKVDNAIIMAAGLSSRFVPISLEKPKGLLEVKGEVLIERQIKQLREAGIEEIVLVLGYKKESFFYLEKKFGVKIIVNPEFHLKNNTYTLYLAKGYLGNSYICSSDDYFAENVFDSYVYGSYYASVHVEEKTNEWYMEKGPGDKIVSVSKGGEEGDIMLGHVYWDKAFSEGIMSIIEEAQKTGEYDNVLWEEVLMDRVKELPPMKVKTYPEGVIFEFDSLDELRKFDDSYVKNTHSKIMGNISKVLDCKESDIVDFKAIKEGLTNTSFVFEVKGKRYVYRHPGEGTETIISRKHEKAALELAKSIGVDPTFIYMNDEEGWKISEYVPNIRTPDYDNFEDSKRVLAVLRRLHERKLHVDWGFKPYEDSLEIEKQVLAKTEITIPDYGEIRDRVTKIFEKVNGDGVETCFCHCDTYKPNWMFTDEKTILIDWEYAGEADPGCDVATYIMDAVYPVDEAKKFIKEYLGDSYTPSLEYHHLAYVAFCSFYWFVWALYREACGAVMGESLHNWYTMARDYSEYLVKNH